MLAQYRDDGLYRRQSVTKQPASLVGVLRLERKRLQDLLLALRTETCERAQLLVLRCELQSLERRDAELLPDARSGLRPEARQAHEENHLGRDRAFALRERLDLPVLDDLDDLLLDRLADPLQLLRLSVQRELRDRPRRVAHPGSRAAVGAHAKGFGALQLQQVGEQLELLRNGGILGQGRHEDDHMRVPRYPQLRAASHYLPADV